MKTDILVYIAGKITGMGVEYADNCSRLMDAAEAIGDKGLSCFCPAWDVQQVLHSGSVTWNYEKLFGNSVTIMKRCDAAFFMPNWKDSKGAVKEFKMCADAGVPTFESIPELVKWAEGQ